MRAKTPLACLALFLFAALLLCGQEETPKKKDVGEGEEKSLVQKDLLLKERKGLQPPLRNIFSPRRTGLNPSGSKGLGVLQGLQKNPGPVGPEPSRAALNLSYIGYIVSGEKIIALIVLEGDILYVEKGDMIQEGIRIGEITASEIEVIGPGSEKKKYLIQGDSE
jgi:hypothetical protein